MKKYALIIIVLLAVFNSAKSQDLLRATRENHQDTVINAMVGYDSTLNFYDSQSRLSLNMYLYWNPTTSKWDTSVKTEYHYHPAYGKVAFTLNFAYHSGVWDSTGEDDYKYNTDSTLDYHINSYNLGSGFIPYYKEDYYYNAHKQVYNYEKKTWNSGTFSYDNVTDIIYHFNSLNQNDSVRKLTWNGSAYVNSTLTVFLYNAQGLIATQTMYSWISGAWGGGLRYSNTYNSAGKETESVLFTYVSPLWNNAFKYQYAYANNIYLQQEDDYYWDNTNSIWILLEKKDYNLNSNYETTSLVDSALNTTSNLMYLKELFNFDYDADGNNSYNIVADYVSHLNTIRNKAEKYNWYILSTTGIDNPIEDVQVSVFPNPTAQSFTSTFTNQQTGLVNIALYNSNGSLVKTICNRYEGPGLVKADADVSNLAAGVYFLQVNVNGNATVKKVVVQ